MLTRSRASHRAWMKARTLEDLADLMASWLAGHLATRPGYLHPAPDDETTPLLPVLGRACRAGYLTDCSQPGTLGPAWDGTPHQDRAYIAGYAPRAVAGDLADLAQEHDLVAIVQPPPGVRPGLRPEAMAVSLRDGSEVQWAGAYTPPMQLRHAWHGLHQDAHAALAGAYQVALVDPVWGRPDRLRDVLADTLAGAQ